MMTDHPDPPRRESSMNEPRPFANFDAESAAYLARKPALLREMPGKWVVFVGADMAGPFDARDDAIREGYRRFGLGPLYSKRVLEVEPVVTMGGSMMRLGPIVRHAEPATRRADFWSIAATKRGVGKKSASVDPIP